MSDKTKPNQSASRKTTSGQALPFDEQWSRQVQEFAERGPQERRAATALLNALLSGIPIPKRAGLPQKLKIVIAAMHDSETLKVIHRNVKRACEVMGVDARCKGGES